MIVRHDVSDTEIAAAYERHFADLATIAEQLNVPAAEAATLIGDILLSTLFRRQRVSDIDRWLRTALTSAVTTRREKQ